MVLTRILTASLLVFSLNSHAKRTEIREVFTNDHEMKTINLTMGRSTILSFSDKPIKVVAGNSNYFNVEYVGNDLTIQPLAKVETNLFVYTQDKNKYGFHLKVGALEKYDDMVYVRWKGSDLPLQKTNLVPSSPQTPLNSFTLKLGTLEIVANNLIHLRGTKTYALDFEVKNKDSKSIKLKPLQVFVSRNQERLRGQQLVFDKDSILMHDRCRGRLFFPSDKVSGIIFYASYYKKIKAKAILKKYL